MNIMERERKRERERERERERDIIMVSRTIGCAQVFKVLF